MEIGQLLKEEREAQQLSLDDIQDMTKIQKRYLQAIENDDFNSLPGRFYARAFIKEYAVVLNMDHEMLLQYFDRHDDIEEDTTQYSNVGRTRRSRTPKSSTVLSFLPTLIVIILVIGVLFVAWMLTQKALTSDSPNTNQPTDSDEVIRNDEQPEEESPISDGEEDELEEEEETEEEEPELESEFHVDEVGAGNPPESELTFNYVEDHIHLDFDIDAEAYISIIGESGERYYDGLLQPNVEINAFDLSEEETVYLNIGNTTGLTIKLNDISMDYPVEPSESVHQKFIIHLVSKQE